MSWSVVVFDWDGTLVDSERHIVSCIAESAKVCDLPELSYDRMKSIIGLGMKEALYDLYPQITSDQIDALRAHYSKRFHQNEGAELSLFPGVVDVLESLRGAGYRLAVATGKSRRGLDMAKEQTGLGEYFEIERCADETQSKPHPQMLHELAEHFGVDESNMLMVGDTSFDLEMAARAGSASVGVSYGVHDTEALLKHNPKRIVDEIGELIGWLDSVKQPLGN
ncbi:MULTISPECIES: HAD family hydrolase [unclassified Oleiphilus]|uniref:HAD family hydrolase n=2 Tax=Oleiphilus TaxID=141450 RepID=UPI000A4BF3DA|nr:MULTISPECIES: HAD-IA family hydrolase [unclassified Oleiphilus]